MSQRDCRKLETAKWLLTLALALIIASCSRNSGDDNAYRPNSAKPTTTDRGQEIISQFQKLDASPYRKDHIRFAVKDEDGKTEASEIDVWRKQSGDSIVTLSVITKPTEDAGTGSLAIQEKG